MGYTESAMPKMPSERCVRKAFPVGYPRPALACYSSVLVGDARLRVAV
jgi:hypothetical protein